MKTASLIVLTVGLAMAALALPQQINYQGSLARSDGSPLDTTVAITFSLYTDSTSGTQVWTETHPAVNVVGGSFQEHMGAVTPITDAVISQPQVWLGITVGSDAEMAPRTQLVSVPYAYRVATIDGAVGGTVSGDVNVVGKGNIAVNSTNVGQYAFVTGANNHADSAYSSVTGGGSNSVGGVYGHIGGGWNNTTNDSANTIGGGNRNVTTAKYASIGGGQRNLATGNFSTVAGGLLDTASANLSTVGGGYQNAASAQAATVGGGNGNRAIGTDATIAGGAANLAGFVSTVGGGSNNYADSGGTVAGGIFNVARSASTLVGGGESNSVTAFYGALGGGQWNDITGQYGFIGSGQKNHVRGQYAVIGGGGGTAFTDSNSAIGNYSVIGGGAHNYAMGLRTVIGGGQSNQASGDSSTVSGGANNVALGNYSAVSGGYSNAASGIGSTSGGGRENFVQGDYGTAPGGFSNYVNGRYGFAAGRRAQAFYTGSFVWADSTNAVFTSLGINTFNVRASGGTYIFSNAATTLGVQLPPNTTAWSSLCDSTRKDRYGRVNTRDVLDKLAAIPIETWSYKEDPNHVHHMGPMAQDFYAAYRLGESDTTISTLDPDGVALAAIQELAKENSTLATQNAQLEAKLETLQLQVQSLMAGNQKAMREKR